MVKYGGIVENILQLLRDYGPMTRAEMCSHMNRDRTEIASVVSRMSRPTKTLPKRLHVVRYVYDQEGERYYPRAVYDVGDKPDVKAPGAQKKAVKQRYDRARRMKYAGNSVFNWGLPRRLLGRKLTDGNETPETSPAAHGQD